MAESGTSDKERVWRNLLDYIESQDMFFPDVVRGRLNADAESIFNEFMEQMLRRRMIVPFKRSGFVNRIAYVLFWLKTKLFSRDRRVPEIHVRGPGWQEFRGLSLSEVEGREADKDQGERAIQQ
jgi:hypothetical protein